MDGLVGYGSSSDDDSDTEQTPALSVPVKTENTLTNGNTLSVTNVSNLFPEPKTDTDIPEKKLDISDEEDNYVPIRKSSSTNSRSSVNNSVISNVPVAPQPLKTNLSKIIDDAQIVSVSTDNLKTDKGVISSLLPKPKHNSVHELELEHLHKSKRRKQDKRKIFAFDLNDYLEDADAPEKEKPKRQVASKSASGLFSILPEPRNCKIGSKSTRAVIKDRAMLMPRTVKPKTDKPKKVMEEDIEETEENDGIDFFAFSKFENDTKEIKNAAKSVKLDVFKPKQVSLFSIIVF